MARQLDQPLAPLIEGILARASAELTAGLSPEQGRWALAAFRETILPYQLGSAAEDDEQRRQAVADLVVRDLHEDFAGLQPDERWRAILATYYLARLTPLSDAAFELARQAYRRERPADQLRDQGAATLSQLDALAREIEGAAPEVMASLEETISEARLDCAAAMGESRVYSIRMGDIIREAEAEGPECASCGARNPRGSRFCNQCGSALACPSCGAGVAPGSRFCTVCGARLAGQQG